MRALAMIDVRSYSDGAVGFCAAGGAPMRPPLETQGEMSSVGMRTPRRSKPKPLSG